MAADGDRLDLDSDLIRVVDSDILDTDFVERRIRESAPHAPIVEGFCSACHQLFDNWPALGGPPTGKHESLQDLPDGWAHAVTRHCSTFEIEASARAECRFCCFLLQYLKDASLLEVFRKIEARLFHVNVNALASLSVQNWGWGPQQLLWLNFPGLTCTHCNDGIACSTKFVSSLFPPSGRLYFPYLFVHRAKTRSQLL